MPSIIDMNQQPRLANDMARLLELMQNACSHPLAQTNFRYALAPAPWSESNLLHSK